MKYGLIGALGFAAALNTFSADAQPASNALSFAVSFPASMNRRRSMAT